MAAAGRATTLEAPAKKPVGVTTGTAGTGAGPGFVVVLGEVTGGKGSGVGTARRAVGAGTLAEAADAAGAGATGVAWAAWKA